MALETKAAFARRIGVNKSTITRAAQNGRIVMTGNKVDIEKSLELWEQTRGARPDMTAKYDAQRIKNSGHTQPQGQQQENAANELKMALPPKVALNVASNNWQNNQEIDPEQLGKGDYKAISMHYENEQIKLEMALRRGLRHPMDQVKKESFGLGLSLRAAIERMIDHTAPTLAATPDKTERKKILDQECRKLIQAMRGEIMQAARRLRYQREKSQ